MMLPLMAGCPPKIFTPRRLLCESRPFFTEPSPFLCAMIYKLKSYEYYLKELSNDIAYANLRIPCTVSVLFAESFSSFHFKGNHFVAENMGNNFCLDSCF